VPATLTAEQLIKVFQEAWRVQMATLMML